jgi:asparagine synthase (glutamine-hydrolysing)
VREIRALPAGSTMWIDEHGPQQPKRYWSEVEVLREAQNRAPLMDLRHDFAVPIRETLRHALVDSLRHHFVADVPVGIFLSSGLDSSAIVGLSSEERLGEIKTLTLGFEEFRGTQADETVLAAEIAQHYGAQHGAHWVGAAHASSKFEAILAAMDQPSIDGINVYFVSEVAAASGLKVALSGLGADEIFAGYPSFRQIPQIVSWLSPLARAPALGRGLRRMSAPLLKHFTSPKYASVFEFGATTEEAYFLRRGLFMPWELTAMLDPEAVKEGWNELGPQMLLRTQTDGLIDQRAMITSLELSVYMRNQLLRDSDWAGMAHSLEIRVPFVDHTLFTTLAPFLTGPSQFTKMDMIKTLRRPLPEHIANRPKTGFTVPVRDWLVKNHLDQKQPALRGLRGWAQLVLDHHLSRSKLPRHEVSTHAR